LARVTSAFAAFLAALLIMATAGAAQSETLRLSRQIQFKAVGPSWDSDPGNGGHVEIEATLEVPENGQVTATGRSHFRFGHGDDCSGHQWIWEGATDFEASGTLEGDRLRLATPLQYPGTQSGHWKPDEKAACQPFSDPMDVNLPEPWAVFDLPLADGRRYGPVTEATQPNEQIDGTMVTLVEPAKPHEVQAIEVTAAHEIVPGHRAYYNRIRFRVPAGDGVAEGDKVTVLVKVDSGGPGRLLLAPSYSEGRKELELADVKAGTMREVYYAWQGSPPVGSAHRESITVSVPAVGLEGRVSFDVGVDFEVVSVRRLLKRDLEINAREPLVIQVRDAFHPEVDVAALTKALELRPVLSFKQTEFLSQANIASLTTSGLSLDWSAIAEYAHGAATETNAFVSGHLLDWNVAPGGYLSGRGLYEGENYPFLRFPQRGAYRFAVDISGLGYAGGRMPEPDSPDLPVEFQVSELDANAAFLFDVMIPCIQDLTGAGAEPTAQWQAVLHCLAGGLESELVQQSIAQNILLNTVAIWAVDMLDLAFEAQAAASPPETLEDLADEIQTQLQEAAEDIGPSYVVALTRSGLDGYGARLEGTALQEGPRSVDIAKVLAGGPQAKAAQTDAARIQEGEQFLVVPARAGEDIRLSLEGGGAAGAILVVTGQTVTRAAFPTDGPWRAELEITGNGGLRSLEGALLKQ
jgi:hypothetical protein